MGSAHTRCRVHVRALVYLALLHSGSFCSDSFCFDSIRFKSIRFNLIRFAHTSAIFVRQLMGLKTDLATARADHVAERKNIQDQADSERLDIDVARLSDRVKCMLSRVFSLQDGNWSEGQGSSCVY